MAQRPEYRSVLPNGGRHSWEAAIRRNPDPAEVARLAHTHGWDAVFER
jgi:hypothetical protein